MNDNKSPLVTKKPTGGRRVKLEVRLSDREGHGDLIDMVDDLDLRLKWTQAQIIRDGLIRTYPEWKLSKGEFVPASITEQSITKEMRDLVQQAKSLQALALEVLQKAALGQIIPADRVAYENRMGEISEKMGFIENAGISNGSEIVYAEPDDWGDD